MATVYLGIGSNLGNRRANIREALMALRRHRVRILKCSSLIETDPVGGPSGQGRYLNGVVKIRTRHTPQQLLHICKEVERALGRRPTTVNGPRPIDLDILLYDHLKVKTAQLTIPHPRMTKRAFVMNPLKEIEPHLIEELCYACC